MFTKNDVMSLIAIVVFSLLVAYFIYNCISSIKDAIKKKIEKVKINGIDADLLFLLPVPIIVILVIIAIWIITK